MTDTSNLVFDPFAPFPEDQEEAIKWLGPDRMDVGCGPNPLPGTQFLYDIRDWNNPDIHLINFYRMDSDRLTYRNVYCRHVLEDLRYPEALLERFEFCEKGWIETPHPGVEYTKGVDRGRPWRGFSHHYWFIWVEDDTLMFLPKTPMVEHLPDLDLGDVPYNTYYRWDNYNFKYKILQHDVDFDFRTTSYFELLKRGLNA